MQFTAFLTTYGRKTIDTRGKSSLIYCVLPTSLNFNTLRVHLATMQLQPDKIIKRTPPIKLSHNAALNSNQSFTKSHPLTKNLRYMFVSINGSCDTMVLSDLLIHGQ